MFVFLLTITLISAIDVKFIFEEARRALTQDHCPFHTMHGLHTLCTERKSNQFRAKLGTGWDPIKAEIKLPFFKLTYDNGDQYTYNFTQHFVADQLDINAIAHNPHEYTIRRDSYSNVDEYLSQMDPARSDVSSGTLSIPLDLIPDLFKFFDTGRSHIISTIENVMLLDMKFKNISDLEIHPFVLRAINSLPSTYDPELYALFIEYWGTHIVVGGIAGGTIEQTVMTKSCFGGIDVGSQASLYLLKQFHPEQYNNVNIDARFQQYSRANIINVWGGDPALASPSDWERRMLTLPDYPVLTNVNVIPITNFISNQTIRANIQKATDSHWTNGRSRLSTYRQSYLNSLGGAKTISYFSMINGRILSTYQLGLGPDVSISNPKSGGEVRIGEHFKLGVGAFELFECSRHGLDRVQSWVDGNAVRDISVGPIKVDSVTNGADVVNGCSGSSYRITMKIFNSESAGAQHACCMDCIPDVRCDGSGCHLVGCSCPPF